MKLVGFSLVAAVAALLTISAKVRPKSIADDPVTLAIGAQSS